MIPEWLVRAVAQLDTLHRVGLGLSVFLFFWSVAPAMLRGDGGSGTGGVTMGNTTIVNNGAIQAGGQGNTQNNTFVNASARYEPEVKWQQGTEDGSYITLVRFGITPNRPWDARARTTLSVKLSGPYESWEFSGAPFGTMTMDEQTQENKGVGFLRYSVATPPVGNDVVIRFKSKQPLTLAEAGADPAEPPATR
jgi:hypothetical protein